MTTATDISAPDLSVVIPVFNRGDVIRYTFESVRRATRSLCVETIIVDDGSAEPVAGTLRRLGLEATRVIRQQNQGLLFARLTGLAAACGRYVLFLDSDDLVTPDKFETQIAAMDACQADVSYTSQARTVLKGDYDTLEITRDPPLVATEDATEFFIDVQPAPHAPMFRRDTLARLVAAPLFPPSPLYNPVAEIWFYHNAAPQPARVVFVPGPRAIVGQHAEGRLTGNWERLAVASLAVMEAFARTCPVSAARARRLVGEKAFRAWRALPRGFAPEFESRLLAIWRTLADHGDFAALGGRGFRAMARVLGPEQAGRLFRRWQAGSYEACRTLPDPEVRQLLATLPSA